MKPPNHFTCCFQNGRNIHFELAIFIAKSISSNIYYQRIESITIFNSFNFQVLPMKEFGTFSFKTKWCVKKNLWMLNVSALKCWPFVFLFFCNTSYSLNVKSEHSSKIVVSTFKANVYLLFLSFRRIKNTNNQWS